MPDRAAGLESVQTFVKPSKSHFLDGACRDGYVDVHNAELANTVKSTNSLLKKVGVSG